MISSHFLKRDKSASNGFKEKKWLILLAPYFAGIIGLVICIWSFHWSYLSPYHWEWSENSQPALLDVATSIASQQDFFRSPWNFPVGLVQNYGYPVGTSLIQTATALIPTVGLKIVAAVFGISVPLQASGLAILIGYFLLGFILYKLFKLEGLPSHLAILATLPFFFIPKVFNNWAQPSLSWVWIFPAAIYLYRTSFIKSKKQRIIGWGAAGLISSSTHTYFLIPVLLIASFMALEMYLSKSSARDESHILISLFSGSILGTWLVGGFNIGIGGSATDVSQVGPYATDLLGLISTYGQSRYLPTIDHLPSFEGQAYLGLGLLVSGFFASFLAIKGLIKNNGKKIPIEVRTQRDNVPLSIRGLVLASALLSIIAIGPTFTFAGRENALELPHKVLMLFSIFRASGRFIWLAMFLIGIYSLVYLFTKSSLNHFRLLLLSFLVLQVTDTYPALDTTRQYISIVTNPSEVRTQYISGGDVYFIPGYPDPASTPWRGQVFKTLQNGSKVHYFAYQGRYSPSKIGNSVVESLSLVKNPNFNSKSVIFVRADLLLEFTANLERSNFRFKLIGMDSQWTAVKLL